MRGTRIPNAGVFFEVLLNQSQQKTHEARNHRFAGANECGWGSMRGGGGMVLGTSKSA